MGKMAGEGTDSQTKFVREVIDSIADAILIIDAHDYTLIDANKAFLDRLGLSREEVIGRTCYEAAHHRDSPCTPPENTCPLQQTVRTGKPSLEEHVRHLKDGRKVYTEVSTSPIKNEKGEIYQVVHVSRDITDRKEAMEEIKRYANELQKRLKELEERGVSRFDSLVKAKNSYLLKGKRYDKALSIFSNLTKYGLTGLCLSTKHPEVLKEMYGFEDCEGEFLWLSASDDEHAINPSNLTAIHGKINEFTKANENSAVLFLGLEYIITLSGFEKSLKFLNSLLDLITINSSRLLIPIDPDALNPRELSLLESALIEIKDDDLIMLGLK